MHILGQWCEILQIHLYDETNDDIKFIVRSNSLISTEEPRHSPEQETSSEPSSDDNKEILKQNKYRSKNFDETENKYSIIVYYRNFGERYDRVIGYGTASSENISN